MVVSPLIPRSRRALAAVRRIGIALVAVIVLGALGTSASPVGAAAGTPVDPRFFGLHAGWSPWLKTPPWPAPAMRLHDVNTSWCRLNPSPGVYDWSTLDAWFTQAQNQGADLLYTFSSPPRWATSYADASKPACSAATDPANAAVPTDASWQAFVTALVQHARAQIQNYEIWNEPDFYGFWGGNLDQMVHLGDMAARIIRANQPTAKIVGPAVTIYGSKWLQSFLAKIPRGDLDVVSFHGYPPVNTGPEGIVTITNMMRQSMSASGYGTYTLWDTEGSWGKDSWYTSNASYANFSPKVQRAYVGRLEVLHAALGIQRFYWYRMEGTFGSSWGTLVDMQGNVLPGGVAMGQVEQWLTGTTITPCVKGTFWTCDITRPDGSTGRIVWAQSGSGAYTVPSQFHTVRMLDGTVKVASASTAVDVEPILLDSRT